MTMDTDAAKTDARAWLAKWDDPEDGHVWSVEMGGLGPGYEQALQMAAVESLRAMLDLNPEPEAFTDLEKNRRLFEAIDARIFKVPEIKVLGLSGAQVGAAHNIAAIFYRRGPTEAMKDPEVLDRKIQVSRYFPGTRPVT